MITHAELDTTPEELKARMDKGDIIPSVLAFGVPTT